MPSTCALVLVAALAAGAGCAKKDTARGPEAPDGQAGAAATGENPEDILPEGFAPPGEDAAGGADDSEPGAPGDPAAPREIRPPGLDLPPAERRARVAGHVKKARAALAPRSRDPDRAISEARAALLVDETSVEAMLVLAHANYVKGFLDLAEDILDKARERGGGNHRELHFLVGLIYERTEREEQAGAAYERAIAVDPNYRSALINLGVRSLRNKQHQRAAEIFERLTTELGVNTAAAWNNLASAYRGRSADFAASDRRRRDELILRAETTYKRAIAVDKSYSPAYFNLGLLYLDADPFPAPAGAGQRGGAGGEMDKLQRLRRAKAYFDEYARKPGADRKRADEQANLAQTLLNQEESRRKRIEEAERRARETRERAKDIDESEVEFD